MGFESDGDGDGYEGLYTLSLEICGSRFLVGGGGCVGSFMGESQGGFFLGFFNWVKVSLLVDARIRS